MARRVPVNSNAKEFKFHSQGNFVACIVALVWVMITAMIVWAIASGGFGESASTQEWKTSSPGGSRSRRATGPPAFIMVLQIIVSIVASCGILHVSVVIDPDTNSLTLYKTRVL